MGLLGKIKNVFADRSSPQSTNNERMQKGYRRSSFMPRLLAEQRYNFDNPDTRKAWCEMCGIAYNLTYRVADGVAHKPPLFLDENGEVIKEFYDIWEDVGYQDILRDGILESRKHGFVVVEFTDKQFGDRSILTHGADDIRRIKYNNERELEYYEIIQKMESATVNIVHNTPRGRRRIYPQNVVHFYIGRFDETMTGLSVLQPISWELIRVYQILDAMARYDERVGGGIMHYVCDIDMYNESINDALETINDRKYMVSLMKEGGVPPRLEFAEGSGNITFVEHAHKLLQMIASATGFSIRYIANEARGQMSTAKEDRILVWERYKQIFQKYVPFIRRLIDKLEGGEEWNERIVDIKFDDDGNLPSDDADDLEEDGSKAETDSTGEEDLAERQRNIQMVANGARGGGNGGV